MAEPRVPPRVTFFNHKGGVGKTTLTSNIAFALAARGFRVLLVDADPQANLTSFLVETEVVDDLLDKSDGEDGSTIWSALKPVAEGTGDVRQVRAIQVRDHLHLLPGDIRLVEFETELATFWTECFGRRMRGFRGFSALSRLVQGMAATTNAQVVIYDIGPNIGPLTRTVVLDVDYFAIPAACDLFSTRAIKTLGHTLASWVGSWATISSIAPDNAPLLPGEPRLIGYIPQRFRVYGGEPTSEFAKVIPAIERAVQEDIIRVLNRVDPSLVASAVAPLRLGEIRDFGSRATASQYVGKPMWELETSTDQQRTDARLAFGELAAQVAKRIGIEELK